MGYTVTQNHSDFDRGHAAGEIAERLREHDRRLETINGSMGRLADKYEDQATENTRLRAEITAARSDIAAIRVILEQRETALAAAAERKARRADRRGSPLSRAGVIAAILAALALIAGLAVTLATRR